MKLHLPKALFAAVAGVIFAANAQAALERITVTDASITKDVTQTSGSVYGVAENEIAVEGAAHEITINVKNGAKVEDVIGGIQFSPKDYNNDDHLTDATLDGGVTVNVASGATVTGTVYGGNVISQPDFGMETEEYAEALGDKKNAGPIVINIDGATIGTIGGDSEAIMGGGGRHCGTETGHGITVNISGDAKINNLVYAGTNGGTTYGTNLNISGGTFEADVYGAGRKGYGVVDGDTNVSISGGTFKGNIYGAGNEDTVKGNTNVTITGGTIQGTVYGGGTNGAKVNGSKNLVVDSEDATAHISVSVSDFDNITVNSATTFTGLEIAEGGTHIDVATEASLTINELMTSVSTADVESQSLLSFSGNVSFASDIVFTIVITDELLAQGSQEVTLDLIETSQFLLAFNLKADLEKQGIGARNFKFISESGEDLTNGSCTFDSLSASILDDFDAENGSMPKGAVGVSVTITSENIPEPTTATLSLLALAALAGRRRRK